MNAIEQAHLVIAQEIEALQVMNKRLDQDFIKAIDLISGMLGRLVVVGMGKSGIIGKKIAATLSSTGTPAFFVHPGEAFHGDLGVIKSSDVILLISNSGETEEVIRLLPFLRHQKNRLIGMTGKLNSTLAKNVDAVLDIGVNQEACSINLAPTSSTTCTLVLGDALAITLSAMKNFKPEDFARFHPGGSIGRKLLTKVSDVMRKDSIPVCSKTDNFKDIVNYITRGRLGLVLVLDNGELRGIITDGDLRRTFDRFEKWDDLTAKDIMTKSPKTINSDLSIVDAEAEMRNSKVSALVAIDSNGRVAGVLQIYDFIEG